MLTPVSAYNVMEMTLSKDPRSSTLRISRRVVGLAVRMTQSSAGQSDHVFPDRTVELYDGDSIPSVVELYVAAESLEGSPVFKGMDVPIEYVHY